VKDVTDDMTTEERQRLNQRLADWFNGIVRCSDEDCDCGGAFNPWER
jgi:hypothetical protein